MDKRIEVAQRIYEYATNQIAQYCEETGGTMTEQYSSFLMIANEVSAYLLGNALSVLDNEDIKKELDVFIANTQKVIHYIQCKETAPKN